MDARQCPGSQLNIKAPRTAITIECPMCLTWVRVNKDHTIRTHNVKATA